jgi:hypothetical protein
MSEKEYFKDFTDLMKSLYPDVDFNSAKDLYGTKFAQHMAMNNNIAIHNDILNLINQLKFDYEAALEFGDLHEDDKGAELIKDFLEKAEKWT